MVGIIAVSHGPFSKALIKSVEMVYGKQDKVDAISLEPGESMESLKNKINDIIKEFKVSEVLIMVDLLGGTPYNASSIEMENSNINVITGLNMPMLLETLLFRNETLEKISYIATEAGKNGIVNVKEKFDNLNKLK
jgi:mannose/fructose/sorbose-specific phosphotransferase system IIA component